MDNDWLHLDLLSNCNLNCAHCYITRSGEIHPSTAYHLVEESGKEFIEIGGGEPALYEDLDELVRAIANDGRMVLIETNGTELMTEIMTLPENIHPMIGIQVYMPSLDHDIYEQLTGRARLDDVLAFLDIYNELFNTEISTVATDLNIDGIADIISFARNKGYALTVEPAVNTNGHDPFISPQNLYRLYNLLENGSRSPGIDIMSGLLEQQKCSVYNTQFGLPGVAGCFGEEKNLNYIAPDLTQHCCRYMGNMKS